MDFEDKPPSLSHEVYQRLDTTTRLHTINLIPTRWRTQLTDDNSASHSRANENSRIIWETILMRMINSGELKL